MTSATTLSAFEPIATLKTPLRPVEFVLANGEVIVGWMVKGLSKCPMGCTYWRRIGASLDQVTPTGWRPVPFPIAQRQAA